MASPAPDFVDYLNKEEAAGRLNTNALRSMVEELHRRLTGLYAANVADPSTLIEYIPVFVEEEDEVTALQSELETVMHGNRSQTHVTSQWLALDLEAYEFGHKSYPAKNLKDFPSLLKLMDKVNDNPLVSGVMNSCLVNYYGNNDVAGRLHSDNEQRISQTSSICTVSLGPSIRTIDFRKDGSSPIVKSLTLQSGSAFIMKPGCQRVLKHKLNKSSVDDGFRFSVSFRASLTKSPKSTTPNLASPDIVSDDDCRVPTVLIAGDSIARDLHANKIGKDKINTANIGVGGYNIHRTLKAIEKYHDENSSKVNVKKLFISVGTNDIRYVYSRGVKHLKAPLIRLLDRAKELFPSAEVYVHSVLPGFEENCWTAGNVMDVNRLIRSVCSEKGVYYLNFFRLFLQNNGNRNASLFRDSVHPTWERGMGLLARVYIQLIHRGKSCFNPDII